MKKILILFSAFVILSITSCDDECINCAPKSFCSPQELADNAATSTCLAEDYINGYGCPNMACFSNDPDISSGDRSTCTVIDCQTLSCEDLRLSTFFPETSMLESSVESGLVANLSLDDISGLPMGTFIIDELEGEFTCGVVIP